MGMKVLLTGAAVLAILGLQGTGVPPLPTASVIEDLASPGPLHPAHAGVERCESCHASSFAAEGDDMSGRCASCHEAQAQGTCSSCHGEHSGPAPTLRHNPGGRFHPIS